MPSKKEKAALKLKAKEEFAFKIKKDKLDRELHFTTNQMSEIRRKIFEQAQIMNLPMIKQEWLHKWGYFERTIDWKDYYISQLRDDIFYYEQHHRMLEQKHNENIDKLMDIYSETMDKTMTMYEVERARLLKERMRQETRLVLTQERRVENVQTIILSLFQQRKEEMETVIWDNENETQLKIFRYEDAIIRIAQEGDEEVKKIWDKMKVIFVKYKTTTSKKRQEYIIMKQRDILEKKNLDKLSSRTLQLHRTIRQCKERLKKGLPNDGKAEELEIRRSSHLNMRSYMKSGNAIDDAQLQNLSYTSTNVIQKLNAFCTKITEAISLLSICRKLETEEEKVAPRLVINPPLSLFKNHEILPLFDDMEQLWAKSMHVSKMNSNMSAVLDQLKNENLKLKVKLEKVLQAFRCI